MPRMYDDPFHHFELSADGETYKCAHCAASYPRIKDPLNGAYATGVTPAYQLHQSTHPDHKSTAAFQEKCPGKASRPAA